MAINGHPYSRPATRNGDGGFSLELCICCEILDMREAALPASSSVKVGTPGPGNTERVTVSAGV
ncbi:MAG: hypothetical protein ABI054_02470 [Planctomycetota bacterium]